MHRDYEDPWWIPEPVRDTAWTDWDYILVEVYQAIESYTSPSSGQPRWISEDPEVYWETEVRVDFADASVRKATEAMKEVPAGGSVYPVNPKKKDDKPFWTIQEWLQSLSEKGETEQGAPKEKGRPPTPLELKAIRERRRQNSE